MKPPTHPSHKAKDKPNPNLDSNPKLREGWVGHFTEKIVAMVEHLPSLLKIWSIEIDNFV